MFVHEQIRGTFLVILSGLLFGWIGYFGTHLFYENLTVENMLFWRFFIATLWMLLNVAVFSKNILKNIRESDSLFRVFLFVTVSYSGGSALYFTATKYIGTGIAMVIFFSFPLFVALIALIFGSWRINKYAFGSLFAVVIGLLLLKGHGIHELNTIGILIAVGAALFYAIYVYGSQTNAKTVDSRILTLITCIGSAIFFLIWSCYTKSFFIPTTINAWFFICSIGILGTALPIQLLLVGLKYISPVKASIISVIEPLVTMIVGMMLLNETISLQQTVGIIIVLLGAVIIQFERIVEINK